MGTINLQYTLNEADYMSANWAQLKRDRPTLAWLAVTALLALCIVAYLAYALFWFLRYGTGLQLSHYLLLFTVLFSAVWPWLLYFVVTPFSLRGKVRRNERLRCETFGQASEKGLVLRDRFHETNEDWGSFATFFETKGLFLLTNSENVRLYRIIPKHAFKSALEEVAFRELLQRKAQSGEIAYGPAGRGSKLGLWMIPIILITLAIIYAVAGFIRAMQ